MDSELIFLVLFSSVLFSEAVTEQKRTKYQKIFDDIRLPSSFEVLPVESLFHCAIYCNKTLPCSGFTYNRRKKKCQLTELYPPLLETVFTSLPVDSGVEIYYAYNSDLSCNLSYTVTVANTSNQVLTSPNYPSNYPDNLERYWLFVKPLLSTLVLTFTVVEVEFELCAYDRVTLYEGNCESHPQIDMFCGTGPRYYQVSEGVYYLISFKTDDSVNFKGFSLTYHLQ